MSIEAFFDHTCDIYHVKREDKSPGYGLPGSPAFSYGEEPDEADVACHFHVKTATVTVTQTAPANLLEGKIKVGFPTSTDIRLNDKIVWKDTGLTYTAELPRNIRGHHKFAYVKRNEEQKPL